MNSAEYQELAQHLQAHDKRIKELEYQVRELEQKVRNLEAQALH